MSILPDSVCFLISFGMYLAALQMLVILALQETLEKQGRLERGADLKECYKTM